MAAIPEVMVDLEKMDSELEGVLEAISYEVTSARTAGLKRPDELRAALKRARGLVAEADSLAAHAVAQHNAD